MPLACQEVVASMSTGVQPGHPHPTLEAAPQGPESKRATGELFQQLPLHPDTL